VYRYSVQGSAVKVGSDFDSNILFIILFIFSPSIMLEPTKKH